MINKQSSEDSLQTNLKLLNTFWSRYSFHDMSIESINRADGRAIVTLADYVLVLLQVSQLSVDITEFPVSWINHRLEQSSDVTSLTIISEDGELRMQFRNIRLFDRHSFAILIPPFDHK